MNKTIIDSQQNTTNINEGVVRSANNSTDASNHKLQQGEDAFDASPPISVEWYEALIQQQRMNDEKIKTNESTLTEITSQTNGAAVDGEGKGDEMVVELADIVSTLADKMGE